jgi:hypothetical protein
MVWWEESELVAGTDDGSKTKIVFTPTNHWSRRTAFDQNKCLWGSWAVVGAKVSHFCSYLSPGVRHKTLIFRLRVECSTTFLKIRPVHENDFVLR